jgi:hypothetical protein
MRDDTVSEARKCASDESQPARQVCCEEDAARISLLVVTICSLTISLMHKLDVAADRW